MPRTVFLVFLVLAMGDTKAQLTIDATLTPAQLVQNVFQGPGVTIQNVQYQYMPADSIVPELGAFSAESIPGLPYGGIVLTTGALADIIQPADSFASSEHLQGIDSDTDISWVMYGFGTSTGVPDFSILEFDFVPDEGILEFAYALASEEYPEYACGYPDGFGFFLSGPGISGAYPYTDNADNLAVLPGTLLSVNVSNINGGDPDDMANCPPNNEQYYLDNADNPWMVFDGLTTLLTVSREVTPGVQYHMRLELADAGDPYWDSALFFQVNSFRSVAASTAVNDVPDNGTSWIRCSTDHAVQLLGIKDACVLRLSDMHGREVLRRRVDPGQRSIQLPELASGIYVAMRMGKEDNACARIFIP